LPLPLMLLLRRHRRPSAVLHLRRRCHLRLHRRSAATVAATTTTTAAAAAHLLMMLRVVMLRHWRASPATARTDLTLNTLLNDLARGGNVARRPSDAHLAIVSTAWHLA